MITDTHIASNARHPRGDTARTVLAAGGLFAAFGLASCCALPVALSMLGIGAASLVGIGYLAAPYQRELLLAATVCLTAFAWLLWRQWQARKDGLCTIAPTRTRTVAGWVSLASVAAAVALIALTFWIEGPP